MPGPLGLVPVTVFAASPGDVEKQESSPVNLEDLSLYTAAHRQQEPRHTEPREPGQLEESVALLRKLLQPYTSWTRDVYDTVSPRVQRMVRVGQDSYNYLKNPPKDFYPRAGVIGFTGVLGLVLGRGSRVKRILYPAGLMALSTGLYYPDRAAEIIKSSGESVYNGAVESFASMEKLLNPEIKAEKKSPKEPDAGDKP